MDDFKQFAGRQAEWHDGIPPKAAIWDSLQTELALHARTKQRLAEVEFELAELRAWKAEAMAWPPVDGLTSVECKVLAVSPAVQVGPHG